MSGTGERWRPMSGRWVTSYIIIIFFVMSALAYCARELLVRIDTLEADSITETQTIYVMQMTTDVMLMNQRVFADHITSAK